MHDREHDMHSDRSMYASRCHLCLSEEMRLTSTTQTADICEITCERALQPARNEKRGGSTVLLPKKYIHSIPNIALTCWGLKLQVHVYSSSWCPGTAMPLQVRASCMMCGAACIYGAGISALEEQKKIRADDKYRLQPMKIKARQMETEVQTESDPNHALGHDGDQLAGDEV